MRSASGQFQVGIVGAGFGGIIAALELKRAGRDSFTVFERAGEVGGVWRENTYPGCACDIPSHLYSIENQPNPNWTSRYASQPEILQYLKDTARNNGLLKHIHFNTSVVETRFVEEEGCWHIAHQTSGSQKASVCRVKTLIIATGPHSRPRTPSFPGMDSFEGTILHSAQWDASVDLKGKRVAVIGTGASAIQIVPNIAPEVAELRVFQRSPAWIVPRGERKISRLERGLFRAFPLLQHLERQRVYWFMELVGLAFQGNPLLSRVLKSMALKKLKKEVRDPELRRRLTPAYRIGCKRLLLSDDFYPALNRDRVHLITEAIAEIVPKGVVTGDGKTHEVDHIVMATGFTVADGDGFMPVIGRNGRILSEEWNTEGAQAYLGINISGYPNMAFLLGPNSGLSHSSALHVMESQLGYVLRYLAEIDRLGEDASLDVDPEAQRVYNEGIQAGLVGTVWNSGCSSWYLNRHGRNVTVFPGITAKYRRVTARFDPAVYRRLQPVAGDSAQELHLPSLRH